MIFLPPQFILPVKRVADFHKSMISLVDMILIWKLKIRAQVAVNTLFIKPKQELKSVFGFVYQLQITVIEKPCISTGCLKSLSQIFCHRATNSYILQTVLPLQLQNRKRGLDWISNAAFYTPFQSRKQFFNISLNTVLIEYPVLVSDMILFCMQQVPWFKLIHPHRE